MSRLRASWRQVAGTLEMNETLNTRTVKANGEAIKRFRLKKGWRVEDLASIARCSVRTVRSLENGANAYIHTIKRVALALCVNPAALLVGEWPPENKPKERVWKIELRISTDHEEFDETTDLPRLLKAIVERLGAQELEPDRVLGGSVYIQISMPLEQIVKLVEAYKDGRLDDLNILDVRVPSEFAREYGTEMSGDKWGWRRSFPEFVALVKAYQETVAKQNEITSEETADRTALDSLD